jgi:hypothetical protein
MPIIKTQRDEPSSVNSYQKVEQTKLLVVEGNDDQAVVEALLNYQRLDNIHIHSVRSKENFREFFKIFSKSSELRNGFIESFAIICDADNSIENTLTQMTNILRDFGLTPPASNAEYSNNSPRAGIFIITDGNTSTGTLEHMLANSVSTTSGMQCVSGFIQNIQALPGNVPDSTNNAAKRTARSYILTHSGRPLSSIGVAAQRGCWDFEHACFTPLKSFLSTL